MNYSGLVAIWPLSNVISKAFLRQTKHITFLEPLGDSK
jgi:hypothetical protein